jgi:hypothetical protein
MALSDDILRFATNHNGTQVGNGECWTLANDALRSAHAQLPPSHNLYQWGTVTSFSSLVGGDIIQFENYSATLRVTSEDGSYQEQTWSAPHHTAIVVRVLEATNGKVEVLEQNTGGSKRVHRNQYYLRSSEYQGTALGLTGTVTITVTGTITLYHAV